MPKAQVDLEEAIEAKKADPKKRHEYPDPTPMAPPVGYVKRPSLSEQIRSMIRSEKLRQEAAAAGFETLEEADDFEVGDDLDPSTPYERHFDPPPPPAAPPPGDPSKSAGAPSGTSPTVTGGPSTSPPAAASPAPQPSKGAASA